MFPVFLAIMNRDNINRKRKCQEPQRQQAAAGPGGAEPPRNQGQGSQPTGCVLARSCAPRSRDPMDAPCPGHEQFPTPCLSVQGHRCGTAWPCPVCSSWSPWGWVTAPSPAPHRVGLVCGLTAAADGARLPQGLTMCDPLPALSVTS